MSGKNRINNILSTYSSLLEQRASWDGWWDNLRSYVLPRRPSPYTVGDTAEQEGMDRLYDTTAVESCQKLASGHMSYITPGHEVWFKWSAPDTIMDDEAEAWYNKCSDIALNEMAVSNFYTEIYECYLDRVAFGTGSMHIGMGGDERLLFKNIPCGKFACAENGEGRVDTYYREFSFTVHQACQMFGLESLGPKAREIVNSGKDQYKTTLRFLHVVKPRDKRCRQSPTSKNMKYEDLYISLDDRMIVEEGGCREFPYLVTRFLKWGDGPYGISPGRLVYPAITQAQFLNRILDTLGEIAAFPRILELANQIGEVDMRAGGRTVITPEAASLHLPREWATQGRYDIGIDRLNQKQEAIRRAYYLPMLELWAGRTGGMTATEVMARENERILSFFPSFSLFVSDLYPAMSRVFALLYHAGKFPKIPRSILKRENGGQLEIPNPKVIYQSKIALVLRRIQSEGIDRMLNRLGTMLPMAPDLSDHIDWDKCFRFAGRNDGVPEHVLKSIREVEKIREERAVQLTNELPQEEENPLAPLLAELTGGQNII